MKVLWSIIFSMFIFCCTAENKVVEIVFLDNYENIIASESISITTLQELSLQNEQPNPVLKLFKKKHRLNKKITAAVLAFPFPFGIVGLHRIYLGTKPYVPVVYIASLGGVFGILPFIDFCAIAFDKDFDYYKDNGKVLMWVRD